MTPTEFKSWFEGFSEGLESTPTASQWARIKARVAEIDNVPVTRHVYEHRYWPQVAPYVPPWRWWETTGGLASNSINVSFSGAGQPAQVMGRYDRPADNAVLVETNPDGSFKTATWSSHDAMRCLGRAEAGGTLPEGSVAAFMQPEPPKGFVRVPD
jgi:hypothetical protein